MQEKRLLLFIFIIFLSFILGGCLKGEQTLEEIDVPEEVTIMDDENEVEIDVEQDILEGEEQVVESDELVARELYLIDANGMVVPQTLEIPKTESAAMQALEYLVKDGPVTEILPNGFQAVLPAGTEIIGVNLQDDGLLIVDLSEEFKNYAAEDELKILQAMTYTLTQFDSVDQIKLWLNGENLTEMPVNKTPISQGLSQKNGINIYVTDKPSLKHSKVVTVYYPKRYNENLYYVPVTQYINDKEKDVFSSIIEALIEGPAYDVQALQVFNDDTSLVNKPFLQNGVLQLVFNEAILMDEDRSVIADDVMETLVKSLTEQAAVDAVEVKVENKDIIMNESGLTYDRPVQVSDFTPLEKM